MILEVALNPARNVDNNSASAVIGARMVAGTGLSTLSFFTMVIALILLPFGSMGMTLLGIRRSPWLATIGGFMAITGSIALIVFVGQGL